MSYVSQVSYRDSANLDAFSRLRVSTPQGLFDGQFTYNLLPLQFEPIMANGGAGVGTITHDPTDRCALMTFTGAGSGAMARLQSYEYVRYQPGRSQAAFITFNFVEAVADVLKFAGLSSWGSTAAGVGNGVEFQLNGTTKQFTIYSDTGAGDETVTQANWNLDKLDGIGVSGYTLDITKTQILVLDLQALYTGRVRVGFDIGGTIAYAHEFRHANLIASPYMQTASLPVRCGMSTSAGSITTTVKFICSAVISEGGQDELGGLNCSVGGTATAGSGTDTHILSIRPKTTFNGFTNRVKLVPDTVDILVTGSNPVLWKLCVGQALSGTTAFTDVNLAYSAVEYNTAGTASGAPALVLEQGYCPASNQTKGQTTPRIANRFPITLDAAGAVRANGTLTLLVQGLGGTSATQAVINWRELR
jgi:hypothetical protein